VALAPRDLHVLTGLVVGKFAPLHKGHEALIAFAQAQCDRLVILSYSKPELPGCPPDRRAVWLAALYPDALRLVLGFRGAHRRGAAYPPRQRCTR
jgi:HTH-type transcriptional repressor of NAD biosynthesis genes